MINPELLQSYLVYTFRYFLFAYMIIDTDFIFIYLMLVVFICIPHPTPLTIEILSLCDRLKFRIVAYSGQTFGQTNRRKRSKTVSWFFMDFSYLSLCFGGFSSSSMCTFLIMVSVNRPLVTFRNGDVSTAS